MERRARETLVDMTYSYKHLRVTGGGKKIFTLCTVGIVVVAASMLWQRYTGVPAGYKKIFVQAAGRNVELVLEIADTPQKRQQGLMFRRSLAKNSGMLFVFPDDTVNPFWMKNTFLPLDILFSDAGAIIIDYASMDPCVKDPCPLYTSRAPYRYAIESNEGFIKEKQIKIYDTINFL